MHSVFRHGRRRGPLAAALALGLATTVLSGCGVTRGDTSRDILMIIPNSPGGGYDLTGRDAVQVLEDGDITGGDITVTNVVGAGGAVAMTELVGKVGDEHTLMTVGLGVVGSTYSFASPFGLSDATPIAQLMSEPEGILVPGDSPFETVQDFLDAWKADPGSLAVGGGSSPGGPDHLAPMLIAQEAGIDPKEVNFVSYDGGGELLAAVLGNQVAFGVTGPGETKDQIDAGEIRALAEEGQRAGLKAREQRLAAVKAGRRPRSCPPEGGNQTMGSDEFMKRLNAIPRAERERIDMTEALTRISAAKFPCPA